MKKATSYRLFVGVPVSSEIKQNLQKTYKHLHRKQWPARWVYKENLHLTLVFIGAVNIEKIPQIKTSLQSVAARFMPFTLSFKNLGTFPDFTQPQIIWLGLKGELQSLAALRKAIKTKFNQLNLDMEDKPFVPHLTLSRLDRHLSSSFRREIGRQLSGLRQRSIPGIWLVDHFALYHSILSHDGSKYRILQKYPLHEVS